MNIIINLIVEKIYLTKYCFLFLFFCVFFLDFESLERKKEKKNCEQKKVNI